MIRQMLLLAMCMIMRTGNAVITPNEAAQKDICNHITAKREAKAKADAKAEAEAKAKAEKQEMISESDPLSIILIQIRQEIEAFIDSVRENIKSVNGGRLEFTLFVEEYMKNNCISIYNEMNTLIVKYNDAITTFVNANESKLKFEYNQYRRKSFETCTNCTCGGGNGGTCILFKEINYHFHEDFMALCGFKNFAITRRDEHNASATYRP